MPTLPLTALFSQTVLQQHPLSSPVPGVIGASGAHIPEDEQERISGALIFGNDPGELGGAAAWVAVVQRDPETVVACCSTLATSGLFYSLTQRHDEGVKWHFASDPRSLLRLRDNKPELDYDWLSDYLHGSAAPTGSPFIGVKRLHPGLTLVARCDGTSITVPWLADGWARTPDLFDGAARDQYRDKFDEVVSELVARSGPVTFQVSGGLDSTFVAAAIARSLPAGKRALGLVASPIPGSTCRESPRVQDDAPYARLMGQHYRNLQIESVVNLAKVTPLSVVRHRTTLSYWPAPVTANLVWIDAIQQIAASRGSNQLFTGRAGNSSFSWAHSYAASGSVPRQLAHRARMVSRFIRPDPNHMGSYLVKPHRNPRLTASNSYRGFRAWLPGYDSSFTAWANPATYPVTQVDPFRSRAILDLAARIQPATWRHGQQARGFARWAGEGRVPDEIRLRVKRGAQAPDEWAWICDQRDDYFDMVQQLRQIPPLARQVNWPLVMGDMDKWAWGDTHRPPDPICLGNVSRLASMAIFCQTIADTQVT